MSGLSARLRQRITLQQQEQEQDSETGAVTHTWVTVYDSVPAEVLTGPGREFRESSATQSETTARITIRWFDVDRIAMYSWRILWDGRVYNIYSVDTDLTGRREWRFRCSDGVNDGA
jgi:SPP1 family predicted phage head-tail adaptor